MTGCRTFPYLNSIGIIFFMLWLLPLSAQAEWMVSLYGGIAHTLNSDVTLKTQEGDRLTFDDVPWHDKSFQEPQYYGWRLTYWFDRQSPWGVAVDFAHAKMISDLDQKVKVAGRRAGRSVDNRENLRDTFDLLEFSHGHNLLTANLFYRWPSQNRPSWLGRLQPYTGLGLGVAIPHVEVRTGAIATREYQLAGPALQGLAGLQMNVMKYLSVFAEWRLSYAHMDVDLRGGGALETDAWTHHFNLGVALHN